MLTNCRDRPGGRLIVAADRLVLDHEHYTKPRSSRAVRASAGLAACFCSLSCPPRLGGVLQVGVAKFADPVMLLRERLTSSWEPASLCEAAVLVVPDVE